MLGGLALMGQTAFVDSQDIDPFASIDDDPVASEVDVRRCDVAEAFVASAMVTLVSAMICFFGSYLLVPPGGPKGSDHRKQNDAQDNPENHEGDKERRHQYDGRESKGQYPPPETGWGNGVNLSPRSWLRPQSLCGSLVHRAPCSKRHG